MLTSTDRKPQKSCQHYSASHWHSNDVGSINFYDLCGFISVAVNICI